MSKSKWAKTRYEFEKREGKAYHSFDTTTASPFHEVKVHKGQSNILLDWSRFEEDSITINGMSLDTLLKARGFVKDDGGCYFKNVQELKKFFKELLVTGLPAGQQDAAVDELMLVLHQGGLQRPATTAAAEAFSKMNIEAAQKVKPADQKDVFNKPQEQKGADNIMSCAIDPEPDEGADPIWQKRKLNFVTTKTGFKLQEVVTQKALYVTNEANTTKIYPDDPKGEKPYVYEALMTIDVDLTGEEAKTTVTECGINYGSKQVQELLDSRGFWSKFLDAARKFLGLDSSKIQDLSKVQSEVETTALSSEEGENAKFSF
ncbi:hypothetical protein OQJ13_11885 [Legionella sp. PATHC035]|uniref:hypothetical protein n=1 Tax=Legionella sp. PATHC035 TaxID=2992040 RepID=UPI0022437540|nr:hypothetical protein [Legionella sp. PATHC035]MCW8409671.1 hypothetical protein [Legionella sp. PATHC035]